MLNKNSKYIPSAVILVLLLIISVLINENVENRVEYFPSDDEIADTSNIDTLTKEEAVNYTHQIIGNLSVPDVGMDVPIMQAKGSGTDNDAMKDTVAHDATTGLPDGGEPIVISGHRHLAFNKLYDIEKGMIVIVTMNEENYYYRVTKAGFFKEDAIETVFGGDVEVIRLYTCYPRARYSYITGRYGVEAERIDESEVPMRILLGQ